MILARHKTFNKHFKTRILSNRKLVKRFNERLKLYLKKPDNPVLNDHKLSGKMHSFRSFRVGGGVWVVYRIKGNTIELYDIGSHNQVY